MFMNDQLKIFNRYLKFTLIIVVGIFILIILTIKKSNAQETHVVSDLEQWTSIGLSKKINKHWKISLDQEFRFTNNISKFDTYFTDLGIDYKFNKHFSIGANYRFYQNKNSENQFQTQHRLSGDFEYRQKINRFSLSYRIRLQNKDEDFFTSSTNKNLKNLRNKFSVNYNINNFKLDPFFDIELYRQVEKLNSTELSKLRWTIGLEYPLKNLGDLQLFYRIDNELNQSYNKDTYIVGLGYKFSF